MQAIKAGVGVEGLMNGSFSFFLAIPNDMVSQVMLVVQNPPANPTCRRCKRCGFDPRARKIPWSRKWQPISVFLPGKFHGQRSLVGYSPWSCKELDMTERMCTHIRCWLYFSSQFLQLLEAWLSIFFVIECPVKEVKCISPMAVFSTRFNNADLFNSDLLGAQNQESNL